MTDQRVKEALEIIENDGRRRGELEMLFAGSSAPLVCVTTFPPALGAEPIA